MAIWDRFRRTPQAAPEESKERLVVVGATSDFDIKSLNAFDNMNITYRSPLKDVDFDAILRDKQGHIHDLFKLADYYVDADPIVNAIIKRVYLPYTSNSSFYLRCPNKKTIEIYEDYYKAIHLREKLNDIFYQLFLFNNVIIYIWKGNITTLNPCKVEIGNLSLDGTPAVFYDVQSIINERKIKSFSYRPTKDIKDDDLEELKKAYPPEIAAAIAKGQQYAQLDSRSTFVLQGDKAGFSRWAIPFIAAALPALAKKELIGDWLNAQLNLATRSFVHVRYGDEKKDILPDGRQLRAVRSIFSDAMSGKPLAVTNHLAKALLIVNDISRIYQWPLYSQVNSDILSAGGIAGILTTGESLDGSTFASAQVSIQTASSRIEAARREIEDFMNKLNARLVEDIALVKTNNLKNIPEFHFQPFSFTGSKDMRDTCKALWEEGLVSTQTMMETFGYSMTKEKKQRENESTDGTNLVLAPREIVNNAISGANQTDDTSQDSDGLESKVGRPLLDDSLRKSDPENSIRSKQVKNTKSNDFVLETDVKQE